MKTNIVLFFVVFFVLTNKILAEGVSIDKLSSQVLVDTINPKTFVFDVVKYAEVIAADSFKLNRNYQINLEVLIQIRLHFNFDKLEDFNVAFFNSAKIISQNLKSEITPSDPLPKLPCFEALKKDLIGCVDDIVAGGLFASVGGVSVVGTAAITAIYCVHKAYESFEGCLKGTYGG